MKYIKYAFVVIFMLFLLVIFIFLSCVIIEKSLYTYNFFGAVNDARMQIIASFLSIAFSITVTVCISFATLKISNVGLEITKKQKKLEDMKFFEKKFHDVTHLYADLLVSIDAIAFCGMMLYLKTYNIGSYLVDKNDAIVLPECSYLIDLFNKNLSYLIECIKNLTRDDFALDCYRKNIIYKNSKLFYIENKLGSLDLSYVKHQQPIRDLLDICSFLELAKSRLISNPVKTVLSAMEDDFFSEVNLFDLKYGNIPARMWFFIGGMIFTKTYFNDNSCNNFFIARYGAAMLNDLQQFVPSGTFIVKHANEWYFNGFLAIDDSLHKFKFNPSELISNSLRELLDSANSRESLYFLFREASASSPPQRPFFSSPE